MSWPKEDESVTDGVHQGGECAEFRCGDLLALLPTRQDVLDLLARLHDVDPADVPEHLDSMSLTWLLHATEQRYGAAVLLSRDDLYQMTTVDSAVRVLRAALAAAQPSTERSPAARGSS